MKICLYILLLFLNPKDSKGESANDEYDNVICHDLSNGVHPHPQRCESYYECHNGYGEEKTCPDGEWFREDCICCYLKERYFCKEGTLIPLPPIPPPIIIPPIPPPFPYPTPPIPKIVSTPPFPTTNPPIPHSIPPIPTIPPIPPQPNKQVCGRDKHQLKINVGGETIPSTWIWQAAVYSEGVFLCSGVLIQTNIVLTAKQCVPNQTNQRIVVRLGDHQRDEKEEQEQEIQVRRIQIYIEMALLLLKEDAILNDAIGTACLPSADDASENENEDNENKECYTTGWTVATMTTSANNFLHEARVTYTRKRECIEHNTNRKIAHTVASDLMLCGVIRSKIAPSCYGDVGSPLVCKSKEGKWILEGIRSRRINQCDAKNQYSIFIKVMKYISWIKRLTSKSS